MKTATILVAGLVIVCWGCGGGRPTGDVVSPGVVDKELAVATVKLTREVDPLLVTGSPEAILNRVSDAFAAASGIVLGLPAQRSSALEMPSAASPGVPAAAAPAGTASCDANGCIFMQFLYTQPNADTDIVDGTISLVAGAPGERVLSVDLTIQGWFHYTADWRLSAATLQGSMRKVSVRSDRDDDLVRFDTVTFSGDEPVGGSLYAIWVTDEFGAFDGTVTFP